VNLLLLKEELHYNIRNIIGELSLLITNSASNQALECLYISQKNFLNISKRYDDVASILQKIAFERTGHYKEVFFLDFKKFT